MGTVQWGENTQSYADIHLRCAASQGQSKGQCLSHYTQDQLNLMTSFIFLSYQINYISPGIADIVWPFMPAVQAMSVLTVCDKIWIIIRPLEGMIVWDY